jgi:mono/diheme cytochrome c family protein
MSRDCTHLLRRCLVGLLLTGGGILLTLPVRGATPAVGSVDFNRDIRRVLAENCLRCHGPDAKDRKGSKGGLRLDTREGALAEKDGFTPIVPGHPEKSELYLRITETNEEDVMPPLDSGKKLTAREIALLKAWIEQGAEFAPHWSYVPPKRPALPAVSDQAWPANPIDRFILARLEQEKLRPSPAADRLTLARRVALDLTGLPPAPEDVRRFELDREPGAYERFVDRLLQQESFGEHWARLWLDQARYADSAGYADDPLRTIWAYRDYLIRSFNANKPFDQFTVEQLAGDLLPNPTEEQLIATAFHRNTPTNSEGGTIDEEFRNVAVVDRVNTTMTVWMGTTMACAQCHTHKYDPFTQDDYFRLFAILNNSADVDRKDEAPVLALFTPEQRQQRQPLEAEVVALEKTLATRTPALLAAQPTWEERFERKLPWKYFTPTAMTSKAGAVMTLADAGVINVARQGEGDVYTVATTMDAPQTLTALRLEALPDDALPAKGPGHAGGAFVITRVTAAVTPPDQHEVIGRYLRIEHPGKEGVLALAEVQVFGGGENLALGGEATQSSTASEAPAKLAIDGKTNGNFSTGKTTTLTTISENPWWEVDLKATHSIERVIVWNRTDGTFGRRLAGARVKLLDEQRAVIWEATVEKAPTPSAEFVLSGVRTIRFASALADFTQEGFSAESVLNAKAGREKGWAIGPQVGQAHELTLVPAAPVMLPAGARLTVTIEQLSKKKFHTLGRLRLAATTDGRAPEIIRTPAAVLAALAIPSAARTEAQRETVTAHYLTVAPALETERQRLAVLLKQLDALKPITTVPIMGELAADKSRRTHVQRRGNYLDLGDEVTPGLPGALHPLPTGLPANRLGLGRWLVDANNPLTARVIANLFWESVFGLGLVRTGEDFGSQGDPPSHPALLDWLAVEFKESRWDIKHLLKLMVTSAAYRQSSRIAPELLARDPENRLLARGPRFRLSAEMIRDQALFVGGLLSRKMYGPPVNPPQPKLGVSAAFGSGIDWENSTGEDRYRRGLYTAWRRSNPYPSMITFDAPSREVCTVRRERSNTPLQALVTLNDPVYLEAAQALARRMAAAGTTPAEKLQHGFRLCLARAPRERETAELLALFTRTRERFVREPEQAIAVATNPLGALSADADPAELAAWTVVGNVLLNLDELLMKP